MADSLTVKSWRDTLGFKSRVFPFLLDKEAEYSLTVGVVDALAQRPERYPDYYLWEICQAGSISGVAWMTPPYPLCLTAMPPAAIEILADSLQKMALLPSGVVGPRDLVHDFVRFWVAHSQQKTQENPAENIFYATSVNLPLIAPGEMRQARSEDAEMVTAWQMAFAKEGNNPITETEAKKLSHLSIADGHRWLWWHNGRPQAMAACGDKTPHGIRIKWIYTPVAARGKGYASSLVALLTQNLLQAGNQFCGLLVDEDNETAKRLYQRIGYQHIGTSVYVSFLTTE